MRLGTLPPLCLFTVQDRRKDLVKQVNKYSEEAKVRGGEPCTPCIGMFVPDKIACILL